MGDFLFYVRMGGATPAFCRAESFLQFHHGIAIRRFTFPEFTFALTSCDDQEIWGPLETEELVVALAGRIALDDSQWDEAESLPGSGGLAARWIAAQYQRYGADALEHLNGNFALVLFDRRLQKVFVVTDPAGAFPVFQSTLPGVIGLASHPDALAIAIGREQEWDETSLAEFAFAGVVSPPFTYYKAIRAVSQGTLITITLPGSPGVKERTYFPLRFEPDPTASAESLAHELAVGLQRAIHKRSLSRFGVTAVALSGGLDSRTILAAIRQREQVIAFCSFDQENYEFEIARQIARAAGVKLVPLPRHFDYYADNAALGIRISGGMGSFANNHFLGLSNSLQELGVDNFLTGCYCDYLFKGLVLNRHTTAVLQRETLAPFQEKYYFNHYRLLPAAEQAVRQRWLARFPAELRERRDNAGVFEIEKLRTFPLWHEGDNAQRLVPQRVLHSYLPFADRDLLELYCKIPYGLKFNRALFKRAAAQVCGPAITRIPDANTAAPINATLGREAVTSNILRLRRKLQRLKPGLATDTSWPDWHYYVPNSTKLRALWAEKVPAADDFFRKVLPAGDLRSSPGDYKGADLFFFVQLLTLKLWFKQRCSNEL